MKGQVIIHGPNDDRFAITKWDRATGDVAVLPPNTAIESLLKQVIQGKQPLLYYHARDVYAVARLQGNQALIHE